MEKCWLLVEWIQKDVLSVSFDVVNAKCLEGNKQDVCVGKLSILREKYTNNARPGKVLYISDDKQLLKNMKSMLMKMTEQMKTTVEMFNSTINQMKTELMSDCERIRAKGKPCITNGNYDSNVKKRKIKSTVDKDTQTAQRYSPDFINELRSSLKNGYEELTNIAYSLQEDNVTRANESVITKTNESKKNKRVTEDLSANAGPIKKKIRAWNDLQETDSEKEKMKTAKTPNTSNSMRQYVNRKVFSPLQRSDLMPENNDFNIEEKNYENVPASTENKENLENAQPENNNIYSFTDDHNSNQESMTVNFKEDMVPIGSGKTLIPKRVYESLNWNSYTNVTRKLLQILFTRDVLSTHSLSGKQSPAFSNRPAKKRLNPLTVDDIVATVAQKCDIKESFVRTCITVKCADEAKMMRQRTSRSSIKNEHNEPCVKESSSQIDQNLQC